MWRQSKGYELIDKYGLLNDADEPDADPEPEDAANADAEAEAVE